MNPVKNQIVEKILQALQRLQSAGVLREVREVEDVFEEAKVFPSLHFTVGGDQPNTQQNADAEDNFGYTLDFAIAFKITTNAPKNHGLPTEIRRLAAEAQAVLEKDPQWGGLALWMEFIGEDPFLHTAAGIGGAILTYRITYRRRRAAPESAY